MGKSHKPRAGSMQFNPRKRAANIVARVRAWPQNKEPKPVGFAGYKAGMTHGMIVDNSQSKSKGKEIFCPFTIIECPPMKVASARFYKNLTMPRRQAVVTEIFSDKLDKEFARIMPIPKIIKHKIEDMKPESFDEVRLLVYTQPYLTGLGKKKPDILELGLGGNKLEQFEFAKKHLGAALPVDTILKEGMQLDAHAITKGKGLQGPVKRFGISLKHHKSEKGVRRPGSLGGWRGQGKTMYRVAYSGQTGFHQRISVNNWLIKISTKPEEVNPKGGIVDYGFVKGTYMLIKGSIPGPKKRLITFTLARLPNKQMMKPAPSVTYVSLSSKQGR